MRVDCEVGVRAHEPGTASARTDVGLEPLPRFLLLRRLLRSGAQVKIEDSATRRFLVSGPSGQRVTVPAGQLSPDQVRDLLDRLGIPVGDYLDMR